MKKVLIYYGPKAVYESILPDNIQTLSELIFKFDEKKNRHIISVEGQTKQEDTVKIKEHIENLVAYSESYSNITEGAVQSFLTILNEYDIDNVYLQNPPIQIEQQFTQTFPEIVEIKKYEYQYINEDMFKKINREFSEHIIGQDLVKQKLLVSLYPLLNRKKTNKPRVIMFYGDSGVGKTETARFISDILGQKLFRKQLEMYQNTAFSSSLFGGKHFQSCFSRYLLEREANVILLDEFDKAAPIFHSAFYQLFDEGIFEDKNYNVQLQSSIIICTSNYKSIDEIRSYLGEPIFYRFDNIIKFEKLSTESLIKIVDLIIDKKYNELTSKEKEIVNIEDIRAKLYANIQKLNNVRNIKNIIEELIGIELVKNILENK